MGDRFINVSPVINIGKDRISLTNWRKKAKREKRKGSEREEYMSSRFRRPANGFVSGGK